MKKFEKLGKMLSKAEQKNIKGGVIDLGGDDGSGTCCYHDSGWQNYECCYGCTLQEAKDAATRQAIATGNHWYYCCASC